MDYSKIPSPCYVLDEKLLRNNLELIKSVKQKAGVEIILAFKAFAMWSAFPIVREYIPYSTASSLCEARLAFEEMGSKAHTYAPVYADDEFDEIKACSSHITFNSISHFKHFADRVAGVSCGLRVNPECSVVETDLYNPCVPGSRLGVRAEDLAELPAGIEGLHFHALCESTSYDLEKLLAVIEQKFGHLLPQIKWLNCGGGHLMTRADYNVEHLISVLQSFKSRHPHLQVILEPGSAFAWRTGVLVSKVLDIVDNAGVKTAMLNVSFACHMPDCLEMPYKPAIAGALEPGTTPYTYRMGGNSCLSGDFCGDWSFEQPLKVGDTLVFEDMIHYTMVKTTFFNGVTHPSIGIWQSDNTFKLVRKFGYEDYKTRNS